MAKTKTGTDKRNRPRQRSENRNDPPRGSRQRQDPPRDREERDDVPATVSVKEVREKRAALMPRIKELREKCNSKEGWTAEDRANWAAINKDFEGLTEVIDVNERADERIEYLDRSAGGRERRLGRDDFDGAGNDGADQGVDYLEQGNLRDLAIQGWMRAHNPKREIRNRVTRQHEEACDAFSVELGSNECEIRLAPADNFQRKIQARMIARMVEERALSMQLDTGGGYLVPNGFMPNLEVNLLWFGGTLNIAEVMRTEDNRPLPWPTADDTNNMGYRLNEYSPATDLDPKFGNVTYNAYVYTSGLIKVPNALIRGSGVELGGYLGKMIGIRLARKINVDLTTGLGVNCPRGIMLDATLGYTAAKAASIIYDDLRNLFHSVDPAYREGPGVGWMLHDQILLAIKLLKDGAGRFLWHADPRTGAPPTIDGYGYTISSGMDSTIASGKKTVLWGKLDQMKVREVGTLRLRRLEERFAELDQLAYVGFMEWDGAMLDAGTHPIKYLQH